MKALPSHFSGCQVLAVSQTQNRRVRLTLRTVKSGVGICEWLGSSLRWCAAFLNGFRSLKEGLTVSIPEVFSWFSVGTQAFSQIKDKGMQLTRKRRKMEERERRVSRVEAL